MTNQTNQTNQVIVIKGINTIQTAVGVDVTIYKERSCGWVVIFDCEETGGTVFNHVHSYFQCLQLVARQYRDRVVANQTRVQTLQNTYLDITINQVRDTYWTVTATSSRFGYDEVMYEGTSLQSCRDYIFHLQNDVMEAMRLKETQTVEVREGQPTLGEHYELVTMCSTLFTASRSDAITKDPSTWHTVFFGVENLPKAFNDTLLQIMSRDAMDMTDVITSSVSLMSDSNGFHSTVRVATLKGNYTFGWTTPTNSVVTLGDIKESHFSPQRQHFTLTRV